MEPFPSPNLDSERLTAWIARVTGQPGPLRLSPIAGGASPRRFWRTELGGGERVIAMVVPPETPEVVFARERAREWPFLEVRRLLEGAGVRVPALRAAACELGFLLVEDLGATLADHLVQHPHEREAWYRRAVVELARAQLRLEPLPEGSVVRLRQFDAELYRTELEHFWEWAVVARNVTASRPAFERALAYLLDVLTALPRAFTHRDYQSRNLIVNGDVLGWIDFQDALLGPRAYDLVALLCDSYQPFQREFVEQRLDDYARALALPVAERQALGREFDLLTLQRKLKDAGRFVFIERRRGDASFLPFVAPTLDIVANALERLTDVPELGGLPAIVAAARAAALSAG